MQKNTKFRVNTEGQRFPHDLLFLVGIIGTLFSLDSVFRKMKSHAYAAREIAFDFTCGCCERRTLSRSEVNRARFLRPVSTDSAARIILVDFQLETAVSSVFAVDSVSGWEHFTVSRQASVPRSVSLTSVGTIVMRRGNCVTVDR